ncbi:MAG TPA: DUF1573 domain-containing protein, partial [Thermoanaerobaculia bacterium]|nr:DUF1573 domain-containing protein [Thermoanaerobaculia bacterium]
MDRTRARIAILAFSSALLAATSLVAASPSSATGAKSSSAPAASAHQPKIVAPEPVKDVGQVTKGSKVSHDFVLENKGDAPLVISEVRPGCGCTVVSFDKTIAPGASGKVHAVVDTTDFSGPIAKDVTVLSNDPKTPRLQLVIKADVRPYLFADPGYARYIYVQDEKPGTIVQTIYSSDFPDLKVLSVKSPYPFIKVAFHEATKEERKPDIKGNQWRILTTIEPNAPVGALADFLVIKTNHPKQPVMKIPISGFVRPVMAATPNRIALGPRKLDKPHRMSIVVTNFATDPMELTGVDVTVPGVGAEIKPVTKGRRWEVILTFSMQMKKGPFSGTVKIKTSSFKKPELDV